MKLTKELQERYLLQSRNIQSKLLEFSEVPRELYFYELCFCICTPQSKASNALIVQNQLMEIDYFLDDITPDFILAEKSNYIRFHHQKAIYLCQMKVQWNQISDILNSNLSNEEKRIWLAINIRGIGFKESSHFLRNIGYRNLAILDRHILRNLVDCEVFDSIPNICNISQYQAIEKKYADFAEKVNIPMDELDLLFWSNMTGSIIK